MNKKHILRVEQLDRIKQYVLDHAITPAIPRATALITEVNTLHSALLNYGSGQESGKNVHRSGTAQRQALRNQIVFIVDDIWETAKGLNPAQHPGIRDLFRRNNARASYTRLVSTASSFVAHLATPAVKSLFTDRGFDANFDADLTVKVTALAAATGIKFQGRQEQKTGTVGLDELSRRVIPVVAELGTIVVKHLRATDPLLIPVWKAAARAYRAPVTTPETPPPGSGESSASGSSATSTPALVGS